MWPIITHIKEKHVNDAYLRTFRAKLKVDIKYRCVRFFTVTKKKNLNCDTIGAECACISEYMCVRI